MGKDDRTKLPTPPVPSDADLRGFDYMPLYGDRLFSSETWLTIKPEACKAAIRLWWHAFAHEVPAASLPDNDILLAEYSGYGCAVKEWRRMKEQALRGWFKCSDGRLYHRFLAEVALQAWDGREVHQSKHANKNERQKRWRERQRELSKKLRDQGITPPEGASQKTLESRLVDVSVDGPVDAYVDAYSDAPGDAYVDAKTTPKRVRVRGKGKEVEESVYTPPPTKANGGANGHDLVPWPSSSAAIAPHIVALGERLGAIAGFYDGKRLPPPYRDWIEGWLNAGYDPELDIVPTVMELAARPNYRPGGWKYFDGAIREQHEKRIAAQPQKPECVNGYYSLPGDPPWKARLCGFRRDGFWLESWGEKPGHPWCVVPQALLNATDEELGLVSPNNPEVH